VQEAATWVLGVYRSLADLKPGDWIIALCTLFSPIVALRIQARTERKRETLARMREVFEALWTTRRDITTPEHKKALNLIDIVFVHDKSVIKAWRRYFAELNLNISQEEQNRRSEFRVGLFATLLQRMGKRVGFNFSEALITTGHYSPIALGYKDGVENAIREGLLAVLQGRQPVSINTSLIVNPEIAEAQVQLQKKMAASISRTGGLKVTSSSGRAITYRRGWN